MGVQHFQTKAINHRLVAEGKGWEKEEPPTAPLQPQKGRTCPRAPVPISAGPSPPCTLCSIPFSLFPFIPSCPSLFPFVPPLFPPVPSVPRDTGLQLPGPSTADLQRPRCFLPVWSPELLQPWGELSTHMFPHVA